MRYLVGTVSPYKDEEADLWKRIQAIPMFSWGKLCKACAKGPHTKGCEQCEADAFEDEMNRRELCLQILRNKNIFGYIGEPPMGNSDALSDALNRVTDEVDA